MEVGRIIGGKYRLREELGEGSMGSVWAADHELLGRSVAIKFLLPSIEGPEIAAARFVAEAKAAARVKHRFVVDVFDFGITEDGLHYMVQELLEGQSLAACMVEGPAWSLHDLLRFTAQCLSGLEAVHQKGLVHRDLKPENIFVLHDPEGTYPKLLDFGISKWTDTQPAKSSPRPSLRTGRPRRLTGIGSTVGTPAYMSPEQLCNVGSLNGRADLYSMGVVLYEWLSGRVPFGDLASPAELFRRISARMAPPLRTLRPDVGEALCALIDRALEPEPERRFASAAEMRAAVLALLPSAAAVSSCVQSTVGTAPLAGEVEATLARAETPFHDDDAVSIPGLTRGGRRWVWGAAAGVAGLVALALPTWWRGASPPASARAPQAEAPEPAAQQAPTPEPSAAAATPQSAPAPPAAAPTAVEVGAEAADLADAPPPDEALPLGREAPPSEAPTIAADVAPVAEPTPPPTEAAPEAPAPTEQVAQESEALPLPQPATAKRNRKTLHGTTPSSGRIAPARAPVTSMIAAPPATPEEGPSASEAARPKDTRVVRTPDF